MGGENANQLLITPLNNCRVWRIFLCTCVCVCFIGFVCLVFFLFSHIGDWLYIVSSATTATLFCGSCAFHKKIIKPPVRTEVLVRMKSFIHIIIYVLRIRVREWAYVLFVCLFVDCMRWRVWHQEYSSESNKIVWIVGWLVVIQSQLTYVYSLCVYHQLHTFSLTHDPIQSPIYDTYTCMVYTHVKKETKRKREIERKNMHCKLSNVSPK